MRIHPATSLLALAFATVAVAQPGKPTTKPAKPAAAMHGVAMSDSAKMTTGKTKSPTDSTHKRRTRRGKAKHAADSAAADRPTKG